MSDIFESTVKKYRGSPTAVVLFIAAFVMFIIGVNHFFEDTVSSKIGLESLQRTYDLKVQIFQWTYWTMSIAPQVASIVFFYMYLSDTSRKEYLFLTILCQAADFFSDAWYRGNGNLFDNMETFAISSILTIVFFSVGSEGFLSVGFGLMLKFAAPALQNWKVAISNVMKASEGRYSGEGQSQNQPKEDRRRENVPVANERRLTPEERRAKHEKMRNQGNQQGFRTYQPSSGEKRDTQPVIHKIGGHNGNH